MAQDPFCTKEDTNRTIFYETESTMVLYDIKPVVAGHSLFVPKRHVVDILELTNAELEDLYATFHHIIPRMLKLYKSTDNSYDLTSQIGPYSGRTIPHLHIHFLPRRSEDKYQSQNANIFKDIKMNKSNATFDEVMAQVARLREEFRYRLQQI